MAARPLIFLSPQPFAAAILKSCDREFCSICDAQRPIVLLPACQGGPCPGRAGARRGLRASLSGMSEGVVEARAASAILVRAICGAQKRHGAAVLFRTSIRRAAARLKPSPHSKRKNAPSVGGLDERLAAVTKVHRQPHQRLTFVALAASGRELAMFGLRTRPVIQI